MLSNTSKYAIRAVIYLALFASPEKKTGIKEIADDLKIPTPFLGKILQVLAKQGILHSTKGPHGGFHLEKPAMDISIMEIIELIDGTDSFDKCVIRTTHCSDQEPCSVHDKISSVREEFRSILQNETIADLASEFRQGKERIRI
jgi:Rrf2 family protein